MGSGHAPKQRQSLLTTKFRCNVNASRLFCTDYIFPQTTCHVKWVNPVNMTPNLKCQMATVKVHVATLILIMIAKKRERNRNSQNDQNVAKCQTLACKDSQSRVEVLNWSKVVALLSYLDTRARHPGMS